MNKNKNLCICLGYESLVIPLNLINNEEEVIVYSNRLDILKFCKFQNIPFIKAPRVSIRDASLYPKKVKKLIHHSLKNVNLNFFNIHIPHKMFGVHWIIFSLFSRSSKFYFHRTEIIDLESSIRLDIWPSEKAKSNIKNLIFNWFIFRLLIFFNFRILLTYRFYLGQLVPIVSDKWLRNRVETITYQNKKKIFSPIYSKFKLDLPECKNLFLFTDIREMSNYIEEDSLVKIHEFILKQNVTVKGHPNRDFKSHISNKYPSFIPAELLINCTSNAVLALSSNTLRYASLNEKVKAISFIDLVTWKSSSHKNFFLDTLSEEDGIFFPQTYDELRDLLQ